MKKFPYLHRAILTTLNGQKTPIIPVCQMFSSHHNMFAFIVNVNGIIALEFASLSFCNLEVIESISIDEFTNAYTSARVWLESSGFTRFRSVQTYITECDSFFRSQCLKHSDLVRAARAMQYALHRGFCTIENRMLYQSLLDQITIERIRNKAATKIQARFRHCISNPYHEICRRRLQYEFFELVA